ncbi:MAG: DUF1848 domain-containing protein [Bacteroidia bacterium]|nr:DUF1848 domain-containing protein [Bacteroidia bacterium]
MSKIISVSRRTDIPAFYADWFLNRLDEGIVGWENPFGGQKYLVSLKREDVLAFAFWSKNYRPFLNVVKEVKKREYPCLFNYTITGLPKIFESEVVEVDDAIDSFREVSALFSPSHIGWRYDPILISDQTGSQYHYDRIEYIASRLAGYTDRCFISFAVQYGKVERNFRSFSKETGITFVDPEEADRITMANRLAEIVNRYGMQMYTCCGDYLIGDRIKKGHCLDGDLLSLLYPEQEWKVKRKPTRKECGCTESTDIGKYDTCPHGCIYCYANMNKQRADTLYSLRDDESVFLGYSKEDSERFMVNVKLPKEHSKPMAQQMKFGF